MKQVFLLLFCVFFAFAARAQQPVTPNYVAGMIDGKDTLPHVNLPVVNVFPKKTFRNKNEEQQYWRMVVRVKKVLPYAREAAALLRKYEQEMPKDSRRRDRRSFVKKAEDELMAKYGPAIKKMSINDGRVLIKLIDRETHRASYDIIHDVKGGVSAVFWQGIARIFGNNLKSKYDPSGEDRQIEQIVRYIDSGLI
jgi:hypothetical protein